MFIRIIIIIIIIIISSISAFQVKIFLLLDAFQLLMIFVGTLKDFRIENIYLNNYNITP
jgi:hypothetical protein